MKKYYVVYGSNAVMIANDYSRALYCRSSYFRPPHNIKKFYSLEDANEAATDHLWDIAPLDRIIPDKLVINRVYSIWKLPRNS